MVLPEKKSAAAAGEPANKADRQPASKSKVQLGSLIAPFPCASSGYTIGPSADDVKWSSDMNRHLAATAAATAAFMVCAVVIAHAASAGSPSLPDFSGLWDRGNESWFHAVPGSTDGKPLVRVSPDQQQEAGDYNNPILQAWTRAIVKANAEKELGLQYVPTAHGSCLPSGVPEVLNLREPVQLLQDKSKVTIIYQRDHQVREIALNRDHPLHVQPSWYGDSIGHYEDDTLVVDTVGLAAKPLSVVDGFGTPHTDKLHVVERYRLITDARGKGLQVMFRVDDPGAFTMPWSAMVVYRPARGRWEEIVCAENNRSFGDGSLLAAVPEEKKPDF